MLVNIPTVKDEAGNTIFTTGHMVFPGDEYVDEERHEMLNRQVSGDEAGFAGDR